MNFVISHRQTSQSDSNPVILLRNRCTSNCCRLHPNTRPGSCTTRRNLYNIYIIRLYKKKYYIHEKKIQHMMNRNIDDDNKNSWLIIVHFSSGENHLAAFIIFYFYFIELRFSWNTDLIFCWSCWLNQIGNESITDAFFKEWDFQSKTHSSVSSIVFLWIYFIKTAPLLLQHLLSPTADPQHFPFSPNDHPLQHTTCSFRSYMLTP